MKEPPPSRPRRKPVIAVSTVGSSRKIKLVCSFNGSFYVRHPTNKLRYIGGETRIISVDRNITFSKLCSNMSELCPKLSAFSLKYQLPVSVSGSGIGSGRDSESAEDTPLVSIMSDEDVRCMIEEYDRVELHGKHDHARLWVFIVCSDSQECESCNDDGFVKRSSDFCMNCPDCEAKVCKPHFDDKVNKKDVVGRFREFASCDENDMRKHEHPLGDLVSESDTILSRVDLHQGNPGHPLCPLNPRNGNLLGVETHCFSGQNCQGTGIANSSVISIPKDLGFFKRGSIANLNMENIMPRAVDWDYPLKSLGTDAKMRCCYHSGVRHHRFVVNDARNHRVYPYQLKNHRNHLVEIGSHRSVRLDGRLSAAKCCPGLRPNSTISKQGQSTKSHGSNSRKAGMAENVMEGRLSMSFAGLDNNLFRLLREQRGSSDANAVSEHFNLPSQCGGAVLDTQSFLACASVESTSPPSGEKMEIQQDLLPGSIYEMHKVPCQNVHALCINKELFLIDQQKGVSISCLSNDLCSDNTVAVEFSNTLAGAEKARNLLSHPKNGTHNLQKGVASSVDLLHNLSLSSSNGVKPPSPSSLDCSDIADSLPKPKSKPLDFMDGGVRTDPKAEKSIEVACNFSALNTDSTQKDQMHKEEIQPDLPSGLKIEEKVETKASFKLSKAFAGIASDVAAFYTHLATQGLQSIKSSDLEYIKELGSGAYGTVHHGKWKGSDVAIKRFKPGCFTKGSVEEDRLVADFWKEAHLLGQLHHPNIVAFYGVVTDGPVNSLATVTEYMVNGSLKQVLRRKDRTIDRRKRIILAMDAAFGMEYLHEKNIVHFDLKSHNFLVNMKDPLRPVCKIGDLGLSKIKQRTLVSGGVRGTIPWMAPELLNSKNNMVTEKVDVYSFGIVMWEVLTGEEPYANMRSQEIIAGIIKGSLRPEIPSWCDPTWRSLMERCWSSDPECRPSFSEIAKELRAMSAAMNIK